MEHGYPVRLVVPGWEGNMWIKWLRRIEVTDAAVESREETSKYTDVHEDGVARKWTWVVISGLAWSGHGQITRVDVSKDGGITWETARLGKQGDTKALTRFYLDMDWDGSPMLLQARAIDETGYVQPTKAQLREKRGENSVYHNNCIQTWFVNEEGVAENVEVS